ncbi:sterile alpha motif domain-containing protein 9-like isoform X2 [Bufo gargarizans]|uniref:sterile alpha motif domain-containing protein 9-like isoform X2 n=1 Tax=Bufo gargarizans TaxID=30331 RepID=UPI001CF52C69|nr:sterile alpha motif domain-containing protein 9-like isoform X2 [Bufo gargarizans]
MDYESRPLDDWTEDHVREWLRSIRIKAEHIDKLFTEEVTGPVLRKIKEGFLKSLGIKQGQIQLLIEERNALVKKHKLGPSQSRTSTNPTTEEGHQDTPAVHSACESEVHTHNSIYRPFDKEVGNFKYVKGEVLPPESGVEDLINPCHEYKSLVTASELNCKKLQAKFASEVIRFASACMNRRTNGTIHFGVMDSKEDKCYKHGQIMGVLVKNQDWYVDALDCIEKWFITSQQHAARACIRTPKFIEVLAKEHGDQRFVVEVDIVPDLGFVKGQLFQVNIPNEERDRDKVKATYYCRTGAKSESILDAVQFNQNIPNLDTAREKAERNATCDVPTTEDLGRKISVLLTDGKKHISDSLRYILVTNQCTDNDLMHVNFLMRLNILCVFDFDPSSDSNGLCSKYKKHHAINIHSLNSYSNKEHGMSTGDLKKSLSLFNQTSWIFCNGRSNYRGGDEPCDESTWVRTKRKLLKKTITFICEEILPKGYFIVVFLLLSSVEKPIIDTFHEFYTELSGMDYIICIAENKDNYEKWASQAQTSCNKKILDQRSIVGMKLSHIDATVQNLLPVSSSVRQLSVSTKGVCVLTTPDEERMHSLEVLCANECENTNLEDLNKEEVEEVETTFYRGGKVSWKHFWLTEQGKCEAFIEREACMEVQNILNDNLSGNQVRLPVARIKIVHQPGSGGSTVARQILWKKRRELRCAVMKSSFPVMTVCEHAVSFREYEEKDIQLCLPVLLLIEDCDDEYIDDLRDELTKVMVSKKTAPTKLCFILLSCKRANAPENLAKSSALDTVAITHKLSKDEKKKFTTKAEKLKKQFSPESIITFILMSQEFVEKYVTNFVHNVMENVDHSSNVTRLMRYVALLNCYIQNSYISVSHCEAFMGLEAHTAEISGLRQYNFNSSLSEQAKLIFIERVDPITSITCIHIIHPYVAQEILKQLPDNPHSQIAMALLQENVLFLHRFGRDEFHGFVRDLIFRRRKINRGDSVDSFLSPLIEHVCEKEKKQEKAIELLKVAYERFDKDPFLAQQLARLHYKYEQFEDAIHWAETAKSQLPNDSFILDTEGQVYKKNFSFLLDKRDKGVPLEEAPELIEYALKAMQCFRAAQRAAKAETETMNNSGYFGEVEVGCRLLKFLSTLEIFPQINNGKSNELLHYLLTDYIPDPIKKPWSKFHNHLKGLQQNIYTALDWISEDISYFHTEKSDNKERKNKEDEQVNSPRIWLLRKTKVFAEFFSSQLLLPSENSEDKDGKKSINKLRQKMHILSLGGGTTTTVLSLLSDNNAGKKLSSIIDLYTSCSAGEDLDEVDLINYIMSHIALAGVDSSSPQLLGLQELRDLSKRFQNPRKSFPASAYLLLLLLYWKDDIMDQEPDANKDRILRSALQNARRLHEIRIKNVPVRKKRSNVIFFLGHGYNLHKLLHRSKVEKHMEGPVNEWRLKLNDGNVGKLKSRQMLLRTVPGFTENGRIYVKGHCKNERIEMVSINPSSVPYGNENMTFYLGFSYAGLVAYNLKVQ